MKVVCLRVMLATDDDVDLKHLKPRLQALIAAAGTENVGENAGSGRIHWSTADVLQGPDQRVAPGRRGRRPGGSNAANQPDLIQPGTAAQ